MADEPTFTESPGIAGPSEAQQMLQEFWPKVGVEISKLGINDFKQQELPLARIKKIMKLDDDVKMISAEAPLLFSKAAEIFISELSLRAWTHTEDNKRRTLQRNDIAMAITKYDQFDFLIDIVPRDELKPSKRTDDNVQRTSMSADQVQYIFQMQQNQQQVSQQQQQQQQPQTVQIQLPGQSQPIQLQIASTQAGSSDGQQSQVIQVQAPHQTQQQTVLQQVVTPSGEVQNVPMQLTQGQLQAIQLQMQGKQPIVLQSQQNTQDQQFTGSQSLFQNVGGQQVFLQQEHSQE